MKKFKINLHDFNMLFYKGTPINGRTLINAVKIMIDLDSDQNANLVDPSLTNLNDDNDTILELITLLYDKSIITEQTLNYGIKKGDKRIVSFLLSKNTKPNINDVPLTYIFYDTHKDEYSYRVEYDNVNSYDLAIRMGDINIITMVSLLDCFNPVPESIYNIMRSAYKTNNIEIIKYIRRHIYKDLIRKKLSQLKTKEVISYLKSGRFNLTEEIKFLTKNKESLEYLINIRCPIFDNEYSSINTSIIKDYMELYDRIINDDNISSFYFNQYRFYGLILTTEDLRSIFIHKANVEEINGKSIHEMDKIDICIYLESDLNIQSIVFR